MGQLRPSYYETLRCKSTEPLENGRHQLFEKNKKKRNKDYCKASKKSHFCKTKMVSLFGYVWLFGYFVTIWVIGGFLIVGIDSSIRIFLI